MTIAHVASTGISTATAARGTTSTTVAYVGVATGRMAVISAQCRPNTSTMTVSGTGWKLMANVSGGAAGSGADIGPTKLQMWCKELDGTETGNVTVSTPSGTMTNAVMSTYSKTAGSWASLRAVGGQDSTAGTNMSATTSAWGVLVPTGATIVAAASSNTDNTAATSAPTLTQTGATIGASTFRNRRGASDGNQGTIQSWDASVTTGGVNAAMTLGFTWAASSSGPVAAVMLLEGTALSSLSDNFNDGTINASLWTNNYGTGHTESGGRAVLPCNTGYNAFATAETYVFDQIFIQQAVAPAAGGGTDVYTEMGIHSAQQAAGTDISFFTDIDAGLLYAGLRVAYWDASATGVTLDLVNHAWRRIRHDKAADQIIFETSANGSTWNNFRTVTAPSWLGGTVDCGFHFETHRDAGTADTAEYDNFNTLVTQVSQTLDLRWSVSNSVSQTADLRWQVRNVVTQTTDLRWQVRNAVSQTLNAQWAVRNAVAQALDLRWTSYAQALATLDARWQVRNVASSTLDARWAVLGSVAPSTIDLRWSVRSSVTQTVDLRWSTRQIISSNADLRWAVSSVVSSALDARWAVRAIVSSSLDARWAVGTGVSGTVDLRWAVRNAVANSVDARWAVLAGVANSLDARWTVSASVVASADLRWTVFAVSMQTTDLRWTSFETVTALLDLRARVGDAVAQETIFPNSISPGLPNLTDGSSLILGTRFVPDVDGQVLGGRVWGPNTSPAADSVKMALFRNSDGFFFGEVTIPGTLTPGAWNEVDFPVPFDVLAGVAYTIAEMTPSYYVATSAYAWPVDNGQNLVTETAAGRYVSGSSWTLPTSTFNNGNYWVDVVFLAEGGETTTPVSQTVDFRWQVRNTVTQTADVRWQVRNAVSNAVDMRWQVRTALAQTTDLRWAVRNVATATLDARWALLGPVSATIDLRWTQFGLASNAADIRWASAGSVTGTVDVRWEVRNRASSNLDLRWDLRNQASATLALSWIVRAQALANLQLLWVVEGSGVPVPTSIRAYLTDRIVAYPIPIRIISDLTER